MIKYKRINSDEREVIAILKSHSYPAKRIAELLGRAVSSVTRELKRTGQSGVYRAFPAHYKAGKGNDIRTRGKGGLIRMRPCAV